MSYCVAISIISMGAAVALAGSSALFAAGGKNSYNNPIGDPGTDTYQTPYANTSEGRILVYCAEGEVLVATPVDKGSLEASCEAAE